jgi:putative tryptophan/tyrosine transport system substrate-binding protein
MIDRRQMLALGIGALAAQVARAQDAVARIPRIGFLISETLADQASRIDALRAGLREFGYVDGRTIAIVSRSAEGNYDRLPELAAELVGLKVDVLVAFGIKALVAASNATTTIPIVIPATSSDPVAMGIVRSFARPGGNVTGATTFGPEVMAKRLQLLKEAMPGAARVAILVNSANASFAPTLQQMNPVADAARFTLTKFDVLSAADLDRAFTAMAKARMDAVVIQDDTLFSGSNAQAIAARASAQRMPSVGSKALAEAGGTIGFGGTNFALYRRGAYFVDRILKGAKPADLPIEQATRFELVVNMKAAKALGLRIPSAMALRADRVIE